MSRFIGNIIEEYAFDTFNLTTCGHNNFYDGLLMNIPIEIKGILKKPFDMDRKKRNGRVWIMNKNHLQLVESKGLYLFIIYDYRDNIYEYNIKDYTDIKICHVLFIAAYRIKITNGLNTKITYKKLLKLLMGD